jgi:hypothetical protein
MKLSVSLADLQVTIWFLRIHNTENTQPLDREKKDEENKNASKKLCSDHKPFGAFAILLWLDTNS